MLPPLGSCGLRWQCCRQQSLSLLQGADGSRQAPAPRSQRPVLALQKLEQHFIPLS
jgi:hypothetical protein